MFFPLKRAKSQNKGWALVCSVHYVALQNGNVLCSTIEKVFITIVTCKRAQQALSNESFIIKITVGTVPIWRLTTRCNPLVQRISNSMRSQSDQESSSGDRTSHLKNSIISWQSTMHQLEAGSSALGVVLSRGNPRSCR